MKHADWACRFWVKAGAFLLAVALVPAMLIWGTAAVAAYANGWWAGTADLYQTDLVRSAVQERMYLVADAYSAFGPEGGLWDDLTDPAATNYRFTLYDTGGAVLFSNIAPGDHLLRDLSVRWDWDEGDTAAGFSIESAVAEELTVQDGIFWAAGLAERLFALHRRAPWLLALGAAAEIVLLIYLASAAGRRSGAEGVYPGWQERIPLDVYLCLDLVLFSLLVLIAQEVLHAVPFSNLPLYAGSLLAVGTAAAAAALGAWMTVCTRLKLGRWWQNTLCCHVLRGCLRVLRWAWRTVGALCRGVLRGAAAIPLVWKTAAALLLLSFAELWAIAAFRYDADALFVCWFLEKLLVLPTVLYIALTMRRLQRAGEALAAGDLDAKVETRWMFRDFERHGENLNAISAGMAAAVERQLKSERLKTELITNVSHDIKTPLTSIINYVDLLRRDTEGTHTAEYLEVLDRQSQKLKHLTEGLVEMSKASTGNLPVNAQRRDIGELLLQAVGEYSERLEAAGLDTVLTLPEDRRSGTPSALCARVDGTLLWRVLDNLFSNACKYAQSGTRFYIDAWEQAGRVVLTFKNISRERLNVPVEELLERFVRGDSARGGEGSGLGLNIAQSLTELQGGTFSLSVDGDLFKAELTLPLA